ncbi:Transposon Ty3-G Gag-Pol polyprotein like [Argiope bruennichi]|uniref:Transposon Ty3-G Gag-Pol polyprotein like n=1 Tax=Argiope bruennichi TaxID=94029 RepID=A0A8T0FHF3_ARGBR|nr:Transposon Ty3-G Gag-Pol polyprotein like [Argiope bruennichi]
MFHDADLKRGILAGRDSDLKLEKKTSLTLDRYGNSCKASDFVSSYHLRKTMEDSIRDYQECDNSFNSLKQALTTSPVLTYPRTDKDFILDTDASNEGIGAVLSRKIGKEESVISYFSKSLGKPERNYCVTRKELLAIVKSVEHFHHYLYGRKFLLRTDHAS